MWFQLIWTKDTKLQGKGWITLTQQHNVCHVNKHVVPKLMWSNIYFRKHFPEFFNLWISLLFLHPVKESEGAAFVQIEVQINICSFVCFKLLRKNLFTYWDCLHSVSQPVWCSLSHLAVCVNITETHSGGQRGTINTKSTVETDTEHRGNGKVFHPKPGDLKAADDMTFQSYLTSEVRTRSCDIWKSVVLLYRSVVRRPFCDLVLHK